MNGPQPCDLDQSKPGWYFGLMAPSTKPPPYTWIDPTRLYLYKEVRINSNTPLLFCYNFLFYFFFIFFLLLLKYPKGYWHSSDLLWCITYHLHRSISQRKLQKKSLSYTTDVDWFQGLQAVVKDLLSQLEPLKDDFDLIAGIDAAGFTLGRNFNL